MKKTILKSIEKIINYSFCNVTLLVQALTSPGYVNEHNDIKSNKILELTGDGILYYYVLRLLQKGRGGNHEDNVENLSNARKELIKNEFLAQRMDELELSEFLQEMNLGNGEKEQKTYEQLHFKADVFEAIVGAVALDCEDDVEKLSSLIEVMIFSKG